VADYLVSYFSNEKILEVLVNRRSGSASDGVNHELDSRSVIRYTILVTFVFWSSARAKIRMKNGLTRVRPFAMRAFFY
jgi:hypothetical protein